MKLLKPLFALMLIVALVGCSSDDDDDNTTYHLTIENFVDTYSQEYLKSIVTETVTFSNGTTSTSTSTTDGIIFQDVNYTFNNDETFAANGFLTTRKTVVSANGETTIDDDIISSLDINGTYSLSTTNSTLTLSYKIENQSITKFYDITKFTETELNLEFVNEIIIGDITTNTLEELRFIR